MKATFPGFEFVYIDAEFTPDNHTPGGLVSFAAHSASGSLYMVHQDADRKDFCSSPFREEHIWSKLPLLSNGEIDPADEHVMPYERMASEAAKFFTFLTGGRSYRQRIGIIADHGTQDMQRLHNLFGNDWFGRMPSAVPKRPFHDLATLEDIAHVEDDHLPSGLRLPEKYTEKAHHALYDARWDREVHEFLLEHSRTVRVACGVELLED